MSYYGSCHYCGRRKGQATSVLCQTDSQGEVSFERFLGHDAELTDVEFVVQWKLSPEVRSFKAHRLILALQNEVFKAMFYGNFAKEEKVVISDLHPDGFHGLLRFFYSRRFQANSITDAIYTRTAAAKYLVTELVAICTTYIEANLKPEDVCFYLDHVLSTGENDAVGPAKMLLRSQSASVLNSKTFEHCSAETVSFILDNVCNVAENVVVTIVYKWAMSRCIRKGGAGDRVPDVIRKHMRPLFPKLRFLALTADEFVRGPNMWHIMTDTEALAILGNIVAKGSMPLPAGFCDLRTQRTASAAENTLPRSVKPSYPQKKHQYGW